MGRTGFYNTTILRIYYKDIILQWVLGQETLQID
ncbi:predicted protein [Botrytis cinerea T4]|uniref:Uncharacterized protein n=1 Tax=Botryotinia fuckeliana (strain T4) TaxID=999810 RepID=G2Y0Q5_BOTF4|nr:predicted protein [Botrytis cinerea T4]